MGDTGHGGDFAWGTSALSADIISITPNQESCEDVPLAHLGLSDGVHVPYMPGDLIEGGEITIVCSHDPDEDAPLRIVETMTLTWPLPAGQSTPADWEFSGYTKSSSPGELQTNGRMEVTHVVKVAGNITKTPSAA